MENIVEYETLSGDDLSDSGIVLDSNVVGVEDSIGTVWIPSLC